MLLAIGVIGVLARSWQRMWPKLVFIFAFISNIIIPFVLYIDGFYS